MLVDVWLAEQIIKSIGIRKAIGVREGEVDSRSDCASGLEELMVVDKTRRS